MVPFLLIFVLCVSDLALGQIRGGPEVQSGRPSYLRRNPFRRRQVLDSQGKYLLEWETNWEQKRITFNVTCQTTGYVGFGLAKKGKMAGSDIVIGGVDQNGRAYFSDRYAIANQLPRLDPSQDWELLEAWERRNTTFLSFTRMLDTCDQDHDLPITDDLTSVIWAYSERDDPNQYHFQQRGSANVYLTDPDLVPNDMDAFTRRVRNGRVPDVSVMTISTQKAVPNGQDTMYWCTWHKVPTRTKQHIIGFETILPTPSDRDHVHHLLLHRCRHPPTYPAKEFFEGPVRSGGSECYLLDRPNIHPVQYCREPIHVWAVGGRPIFLPEHVGLPMSADFPDEYFMLQVHYDNTAATPNLTASVSLNLFYTDKIRENDAAVLQLGTTQPGQTTIIVPPSSTNHVIVGHCAPGCTQRMFGDSGATIVAMFMHTHRTGTAVRNLHFRGDRELPWILSDDNYNFDYQQFRLLKRDLHIRPSDQITTRCSYDNTARNGSVVVGGFSTQQEMCTSFAYYYSRAPGFAMCRSEITNANYTYGLLGINQTTWNPRTRDVEILNPPEYRGLTLAEYYNTQIDWSIEFRERLQREQLYQTQTTLCPRFFYNDIRAQVRIQVEDGVFDRVGRLSGSDGRRFTSVDRGYIQEASLPTTNRYTPPPQCTRRNN